MKNASKILRQAQAELSRLQPGLTCPTPSSIPLTGSLLEAYPKANEREEFFNTPEYKAIRQLVNKSIQTHGLVDGATPKKKSGRFVVRLPHSLHEALELEAQSEGVSLNQLVVAKLAVQLNSMAGDPMALIVQAFLEVRQGYDGKGYCGP